MTDLPPIEDEEEEGTLEPLREVRRWLILGLDEVTLGAECDWRVIWNTGKAIQEWARWVKQGIDLPKLRERD